jgi:hypothetical protein
MTLRGRFGFAYSFFFGRELIIPLKALSSRAEQCGAVSAIADDLDSALEAIQKFLESARPRELKWKYHDPYPLLLYTDGAVEKGVITCGAVLFDVVNDEVRYFGDTVPESFVQQWEDLGVVHAVAQSELIPVAVSRIIWRSRLRDRRVIHFIDNEGIRQALITGSTKSLSCTALLSQTARLGIDLGANFWYARIPSQSNISDDPSRLEFASVAGLRNSARDTVEWPPKR